MITPINWNVGNGPNGLIAASCLRAVCFCQCRLSRLAVLIGVALGVVGTVWGNDMPVQEGPDVVVERREGKSCFVVNNLANPAGSKVQVWRIDSDVESSPPMMGTSVVLDENLVFRPRFPVRGGNRYVVKVWPNADSNPSRFELTVPGGESAPSRVLEVYPTSERLPENLLKFYVQFSAPMQKGEIYRFVRLRETGGQNIELPFLEIEQEFWSRDSKRLTLLLDPGRIKRGLKPREEMGPILVAGESYELVIDGNWPDAQGRKLGSNFVKPFVAVAEDRTQPNPGKWKWTAPKAGGREPLLIQFPGSLDRAMLMQAIVIFDPGNIPVKGNVVVTDNEHRWSFEPDQQWQMGRYRMVVNAALEDNAGNSIGRPFDVDLFDKTEPSDALPDVELTFDIAR